MMTNTFNQKVKTIILASILVLLICTISFAGQSGGETAANFLRIDIGAQSAAMGGAYTAVANGAISSFWNPANIIRADKRNVILGHQSMLQDIALEYGSIGFGYTEELAGNVAIIYMGYGEIAGYDAAGLSTGLITAYDLMVSTSGSYQLNENFSAGLTVKFIRQQLDQNSASTIAGDFGLQYSNTSWSAGLVLSNFGGTMKFINISEKLPTEIRLGLAAKPFVSDITLAVDIANQFHGGLKLANGLQIGFDKQYFVRGGWEYKQNGQEAGWQATYNTGLGMIINEYSIDYSFSIGDKLTEEDLHRFSIGYNF